MTLSIKQKLLQKRLKNRDRKLRKLPLFVFSWIMHYNTLHLQLDTFHLMGIDGGLFSWS